MEGGTLLVGVGDRMGRLVGLEDDLKLFIDFHGLANHVSQRLHWVNAAVAPSIDVLVEDVEGQPVLRTDACGRHAVVPPGSSRGA
jgi:hypothetical protein